MLRTLVAAIIVLLPATADAEVLSAGPNGFEIQHSVSTVAPPQATFDAFGRVAEWWNADHTYSGKAANLSLALSPGCCFCERLDSGGAARAQPRGVCAPGR